MHSTEAQRLDFVRQYLPYVQKIAKQYNVPAHSILGQWALESDWGTVTTGKNNIFGIKSVDPKSKARVRSQTKEQFTPEQLESWKEKLEGREVIEDLGPVEKGKNEYSVYDYFRSFETPEEATTIKSEFLKRFPKIVGAKDTKGYAEGLLQGTFGPYATDKDYVKNLVKMDSGVLGRIKLINAENAKVENNRSGGIVGNMEMQYRQPAQGLAALGRGPDTELVHMTPNEVQGLQSLAQGFGGSLTTNPDTGLPEAGFLSNILPMLIGGGLAIATGGLSSAFINPLTIGGAMGLGGLAASGGDLKQGLKYGLGGFGGASLAGSLAGAGAAQAGATGTGSALGAGAGTGAATTAAQQAAFNRAALGGTSAAVEGAKFGITGGATTGLGNIGKTFTSTDALGRLATDPAIKRGLISGAVGLAAGYTPPKQEGIEIEKEKNFFPEGGYQTNRTAQNVAPLERDSFGNFIPRTSEATYFNPNSGGITQVNPNARNYYGPEGTEPNFYGGGPYGTDSSAAYTPPPSVRGPFGITMNPSKNPNAEKYNYPVGGYQYAAQGGLMGFADGGLTKGPGDGMSDDIMTSISGQQAAALSPGEFVVPADVVSDMGNGDTGAGAKQLYAMMDRVRKARGGSIEQPDAINPNEYMPA